MTHKQVSSFVDSTYSTTQYYDCFSLKTNHQQIQNYSYFEYLFWGQHMNSDLETHFASARIVQEENEKKYARAFINIDHSFNT